MSLVLVAGFPAGPFQTNCWVVATSPGQEAIVVDPGMDSRAGVEGLLREHRLRPVAVLLTHGHLDHMWSVTPVCDGYGIPAWIHPADRHLLVDPFAGVAPQTAAALAGLVGADSFVEPASVAELSDGAQLDIAGIRLIARHAPGHTPGSVAFEVPQRSGDPALVTGDLLFAGSIGRTDLPGGDDLAMEQSLRRVILPQDDITVVLPGHGPTTTIGQERRANPFLLELLREPRAGGRR